MTKYSKFQWNQAFSMMYGLFFATMVLLSTGVARAQIDSEMFKPSDHDFSLAILSQLFGDLIKIAGGEDYKGLMFLGTGFDPFKDILTSFNMMCAVVALTLLATSLINKLTDMSEKQQAGDLATSLFWVRMGTGGTFIIPIHSGYCVLQVLVMWLIIQSVGAADHILRVWLGISNSPKVTESMNPSHQSNFDALYRIKMPSPQMADLVYRTAEGYTCAYGVASQQVHSEFQYKFETTKSQALQASGRSDTLASYTETRKSSSIVQNQTVLDWGDNDDGVSIGATNGAKPLASVRNEIETTYQKEQTAAEQVAAKRRKDFENAEQQAFNTAQAEVVGLLDKAVGNIFMVQSLENDRIPTTNIDVGDGRNVKFPLPYFFGIQSMEKSMTQTGNAGELMNRDVSAVCGYVDFSTTVNSNAARQLFENANSAVKRLTEQKKITEINAKRTSTALAQGEAAIKRSKYDPAMIAAYVEVFEQFRPQIAAAAKAYVNAVNVNVRFVKSESGMWIQNPLSLNQFKAIRLKLLDQFNAQLATISRNMEEALQARMWEYYQETANRNIVEMYLRSGWDALPQIQAQSNLRSNFIESRELANAIAFRDGWFALGSTTMLLVNSINQLQTMANFSPSMSYAVDDIRRKQLYSALIGDGSRGVRYPELRTNAYEDIKAYYGLYKDIAIRSELPQIIRSLNPPSGAVNSIAALAIGLDLSSFTSTDRHPLIVMVEAGYSLLNASEKFMTYNAYWEARDGKARPQDNRPMDGNPANVASQASMMLTTAMATMLVLGFMLAFYLPVLPFLIWVGACLGWLVSVIEAIFICPLWAAMHLSSDGNKLVGKAQAGYSLLMALLFRAPMMVMGFIAAFTILQVYGIYLNYIFGFSVMLSLGGDFSTDEMTFVSLTTILAAYIIYAMYMQIIITKIFNVTTVLADQSLKWIGGSQGNLGEYGGMAGNEMSGKIQGFAQPLSTAGLQRRVDAAREAGMTDRKDIAPVADASGLKPVEREVFEGSSTGRGYDAMFNNGQASASSVTGLKVQNPDPQTPIEKAAYDDIHKNAMEMGRQAGMSDAQANDFAGKVAQMGYKDENLRHGIANYAARGVYGRGDNLEANRQHLMDIAENSNNSAHFNYGMTDYVKDNGLSSSRELQRPHVPQVAGLSQPSFNGLSQASGSQTQTAAQAPSQVNAMEAGQAMMAQNSQPFQPVDTTPLASSQPEQLVTPAGVNPVANAASSTPANTSNQVAMSTNTSSGQSVSATVAPAPQTVAEHGNASVNTSAPQAVPQQAEVNVSSANVAAATPVAPTSAFSSEATAPMSAPAPQAVPQQAEVNVGNANVVATAPASATLTPTSAFSSDVSAPAPIAQSAAVATATPVSNSAPVVSNSAPVVTPNASAPVAQNIGGSPAQVVSSVSVSETPSMSAPTPSMSATASPVSAPITENVVVQPSAVAGSAPMSAPVSQPTANVAQSAPSPVATQTVVQSAPVASASQATTPSASVSTAPQAAPAMVQTAAPQVSTVSVQQVASQSAAPVAQAAPVMTSAPVMQQAAPTVQHTVVQNVASASAPSSAPAPQPQAVNVAAQAAPTVNTVEVASVADKGSKS